MKQRSRTNPRQTELFQEPGLTNVAIPLGGNRDEELKRTIAELLINVALADAGVRKGDECDE
jgi:hypothetical protein